MSDRADEFLRSMGIPLLNDEMTDEAANASEASTAAADLDSAMASSAGVDEELEKLWQEAQALRQQLRDTEPAHAAIQGSDSTGSIAVTLDEHGRVDQVSVRSSWRRAIAETGFDAAVLEAVTEASTKRLTGWVEAATDTKPEARHAGTELREHVLQSEPKGQGPSLHDGRVARESMQEALSLLEGIEDELDVLQQTADRIATTPVEGRNPEHTVTVRVTATGQVVSISTNRRLLQRADPNRLARELHGALRDGYARAGTLGSHGLLGSGNLQRIQDLVSDPEALGRLWGSSR